MSTPRYEALCEHLRLFVHPTECVLVGSAPLAVLGLRDVNDLDALVCDDVMDSLKTCMGWECDDWFEDAGRQRTATAQTEAGQIQASTRLHSHAAGCGLSEWEIWLGAHRSGAIPFRIMSAPHMEIIKKFCDREKDQADLRLLEAWKTSKGLTQAR